MNILKIIFIFPLLANALIVSGLSVEGRRSSLLDRTLDRALDRLISEKHLEKVQRKRRVPPRNYLASDEMVDGEHEVRLHFTGVSAKQTSVGPREGSPHGLVLREVSDGRQLVYLVYTGMVPRQNASEASPDSDSSPEDGPHLRLHECQVLKDPLKVSSFVDAFKEESRKVETTDAAEDIPDWQSEQFVVLHSLTDVPAYLRPLANFRTLRRQCRRHHKAQKKAARKARRNRHRYSHSDAIKASSIESLSEAQIDDPRNHELQADHSAENHHSR